MAVRRRPCWDLERLVKLAVAAINAVASLVDALRKIH